MSFLSPSEDAAGSLAEKVRKLEKINKALMNRVERSLEFSGGAFSLFQTAILLDERVKARTKDLEQTLDTLSNAYVGLQEARDEAEMAKQNLTAAIEAVNEGFALFDSEERLLLWNKPYQSLMPDIASELMPGCRFAEIVELFANSRHLIPEEGQSREDWQAARMALFRRPYASFIQQFSGDRWLQISNRKTSSGATVILQTDITDTVRTERVRYERELDEQAKVLRATIDHLPQGICMFSKTMELRAWNRSLVDLLSLPMKFLTPSFRIARLFEWLQAARFTMSEQAAERLAEWLANPSLRSLRGVEIQRSDGAVLAIGANAMPDGGIVATFTDVTRERQATLALQQYNETLEQRVEERTAELRREVLERRAIEIELLKAKEIAEEANKGKTQFLAAASHDLLQPLNASRIFLSLLQETDLNSRQLRFLDNANRAFASVEQLLEGLLDISRFETRSVETNVMDFPVNNILQTLVSEFQPISERKGLRLCHVPSSRWVRSDPGLLRRIVQNLLSNAIRYTNEGGVVIGVRNRRGALAIEIWDTGMGIPEDKHRQVFEAFHRLHHASGTDEKAMGLGLAIVDRIARLLGHKVSLRSVVSRGSCFTVEVEQAKPAQSALEVRVEAAPQLQRTATRKTIIVVENDLQILEGMVELLDARNFHAIPTVSAEEALESLESLDCLPSLILADFHLDSGTGLEAVQKLREASGRQIPAIMVTADHSAALRTELARQAIGFLGKPLHPAKLFAAIADLMT